MILHQRKTMDCGSTETTLGTYTPGRRESQGLGCGEKKRDETRPRRKGTGDLLRLRGVVTIDIDAHVPCVAERSIWGVGEATGGGGKEWIEIFWHGSEFPQNSMASYG